MDKELNKKAEEKDELDELGYQQPFNIAAIRHEHELFNDEDYVKQKLVNVKMINLPKKGIDWEILEDGKVILLLKGTRFTNTEKKFLKTIKGMKFLMEGWKKGWKSVIKFKSEMQRYV